MFKFYFYVYIYIFIWELLTFVIVLFSEKIFSYVDIKIVHDNTWKKGPNYAYTITISKLSVSSQDWDLGVIPALFQKCQYNNQMFIIVKYPLRLTKEGDKNKIKKDYVTV